MDALRSALEKELAGYRRARRRGDIVSAWIALERAHIFSQPRLGPHLRVHGLMLGLAVRTHDWREIRGQMLRLALAPLGNLAGRIPQGNTGRSNVSAFRPMAVPDDLRRIMATRSEP
jgi:hypothetical protein